MAKSEDNLRIHQLFEQFAMQNPAPKTELAFKDAYTLLVSVVLSAQATDVGVNKATGPLFEAAGNPAAMVDLGEEQIASFIRTLGLFRNKAKNVHRLSQILLEQHGGEVPRDREALEALPGVGRKTANVVLNELWGEPVIAVDTHVFRVSNRLEIAPGKNVAEVEKRLDTNVPDEWKRYAHHWLILHGRHICKARKPLCHQCPVSELCRSDDRQSPDD